MSPNGTRTLSVIHWAMRWWLSSYSAKHWGNFYFFLLLRLSNNGSSTDPSFWRNIMENYPQIICKSKFTVYIQLLTKAQQNNMQDASGRHPFPPQAALAPRSSSRCWHSQLSGRSAASLPTFMSIRPSVRPNRRGSCPQDSPALLLAYKQSALVRATHLWSEAPWRLKTGYFILPMSE